MGGQIGVLGVRKLFAVLIITVFLATGCGKPSGQIQGLVPAHLTIWQNLSSGAGPLIEGAIESSIEKMGGVSGDISVEVTYIADLASVEKQKSKFLRGDGPDIIITRASTVAEYAQEGLLLNLDFVRTRRPKVFVEAAWELGRVKDECYAIAWGLETWALALNSDLVPVPPETTVELLRKIAELRSINIRGMVGPFTSPVSTFPLYASSGDAGAYFTSVRELAALGTDGLALDNLDERRASEVFSREEAGIALISQNALWSLEKSGINYSVIPWPNILDKKELSIVPIDGIVACISSYSDNDELSWLTCTSSAYADSLLPLLEWAKELPATVRLFKGHPFQSGASSDFYELLNEHKYINVGVLETRRTLEALRKGLSLLLTQGVDESQVVEIVKSLGI